DPQPILKRPAGLGQVGDAAPDSRAILTLKASPSITASGTALRFGVPLAAHGRVTIYDVAGRIVTMLDVAPGLESVRWDGRGTDGMAARAGVYYARLSIGASSREAMIFVVR